MQRYIAALILLLLVGTVVARVLLMRRSGMNAMHFGKTDKKAHGSSIFEAHFKILSRNFAKHLRLFAAVRHETRRKP